MYGLIFSAKTQLEVQLIILSKTTRKLNTRKITQVTVKLYTENIIIQFKVVKNIVSLLTIQCLVTFD